LVPSGRPALQDEDQIGPWVGPAPLTIRHNPPVNHVIRRARTSHQLRKRAFTAAWQNSLDPRKAAIAYGCNVDTLMKHYVSLDEQEVTDEVTKQLAGALASKQKSPPEPSEK